MASLIIECKRKFSGPFAFPFRILKETVKVLIRNIVDKKVGKVLENKWKSVAKQLIINLTRKRKNQYDIIGKKQTSQT